MDINAQQLILALDDYMKNNGGGTKYLATRMRKLFDNKDSALNADTGPIALLAKTCKDFAKKIEKLSKSTENAITPFVKNMDNMDKVISKITTMFDSNVTPFLQNLRNVPPPLPTNGTGNNDPIVQNQQNVLWMESLAKIFQTKPIPITIQNIDPQVIKALELMRNKEEILPEKNTLSSIMNSVFGKKEKQSSNVSLTNIQNGNDSESSSKGSSSLLGSVLKWGALLLSGAFIIKLLNETPLGQKIKDFIKDSIRGIFTWIGEKLTNPETQKFLKDKINYILDGLGSLMSMFGSAFKTVWNGLVFIAQEFYDKIFLKVNEENEGLSKILAAGVLKAIPKFFGKTTAVISFIMKGAAKHFTTLAKVFKFIPGVGSLLSFAFAVDRFKKGDYFGGILEVAAGIAYFFPGIGTAIGVGVDLFNTFLDYKQTQPDTKNMGKSEIVVGLLESATEWFIGKFGVDRLYQIPVIGPMMKIVKGLTLLSTDPAEGMKTVLKGIFAFNPLTQLANAVSFIDFLMNGDVATDPNVKGSMSDWFNSDIWIDKIGGFIGGIVDVVTEKVGWIFGKVKSAMEWIFGKAESEMTPQEKSLELTKKKSETNRVNNSNLMYGINPTTTVSVKPVKDAHITVVKPDSKDHHLFAKDGGPFDNFLKEMNANFDEKLSMLVALSNETIGAILQGNSQVSQTIVATSGSKSSDSPKSYGNGDPIRDQRNRANMTISR